MKRDEAIGGDPRLGNDEGAIGSRLWDWIREHVEPAHRTLELGSGASTRLFDAIGCDHTAVEQNAAIADELRKFVSTRCRVVHAPLGEQDEDPTLPHWYRFRPEGEFDVILVDGPLGSTHRPGIVRHLHAIARPETTVLVDDTHRAEDRELAEFVGRRLCSPVEHHSDGRKRFAAVTVPARGDIVAMIPVHNRLAYTRRAFPALVEACRRSSRVRRLTVYDDVSEDGSGEFCQEGAATAGLPWWSYVRKRFSNSTGQVVAEQADLGHAFRRFRPRYLLKVDNDIVVHPDTIDALAEIMDAHPSIGYLGLPNSRQGEPIVEPGNLEVKPASHVGGVGLFRFEAMRRGGRIRSRKRWFGFQDQQRRAKKAGWDTAWAKGISVLNLDDEPDSLRGEYVAKGWGRTMPQRRPKRRRKTRRRKRR